MRGRRARWLAGAACAAVLWASLEVAWSVFQPYLPFEALRLPSQLPPRAFGAFLGVALATHLPLALALGWGSTLLLGRRLPSDPGAGVVWGALAGGLPLAALGVLVWLNLLSGLPPLHWKALLLDALAVLVLAVVLTLGAWISARVLRRAAIAMALLGVLAPGVLVLCAWFAHGAIEYQPVVRRGEARPDAPNLILVTLDTLRADHVGAWSEGRVQTPVLDRFSTEGVRFVRALAQVPHTTPSHVSIFTSLYPFAHGARNGVPMAPDVERLPALLRAAGYHTAAFVSAYTTKSNVTGLGDDFDVYVDSLSPWISFLAEDHVEPLAVYRVLDRVAGNQIPAPVVNARILDWLGARPEEPFFLWAHYFDVHGPFTPAPEYRELYVRPGQSDMERAMALYDAEITYLDEEIGGLFDRLREAGVLENSIVVFTSDHGEAFREPHPRPEYGHGRTLYDPVLWVPLIFWGPGRVPADRVVESQVQTIDLAPTLLELAQLPPSDSFRGQSLVPLFEGRGDHEEVAFSQTAGHERVQWYAVRTPDWKLHLSPSDGNEELFDLAADPGETLNLIDTRPTVAARYREQLTRTMRTEPGDALPELDADTVERLRELGYIVE